MPVVIVNNGTLQSHREGALSNFDQYLSDHAFDVAFFSLPHPDCFFTYQAAQRLKPNSSYELACVDLLANLQASGAQQAASQTSACPIGHHISAQLWKLLNKHVPNSYIVLTPNHDITFQSCRALFSVPDNRVFWISNSTVLRYHPCPRGGGQPTLYELRHGWRPNGTLDCSAKVESLGRMVKEQAAHQCLPSAYTLVARSVLRLHLGRHAPLGHNEPSLRG